MTQQRNTLFRLSVQAEAHTQEWNMDL